MVLNEDACSSFREEGLGNVRLTKPDARGETLVSVGARQRATGFEMLTVSIGYQREGPEGAAAVR